MIIDLRDSFGKYRFCLYFFRKLVEVAWLIISYEIILQSSRLSSKHAFTSYEKDDICNVEFIEAYITAKL